MSDKMNVQALEVLLDWILKEYESSQSIFGIHRSLFYTPKEDSPYALEDLFGHHLATPSDRGRVPIPSWLRTSSVLGFLGADSSN